MEAKAFSFTHRTKVFAHDTVPGNAGAKHMIAALQPKYFTQLGLVSLVVTHQHLQRSA